MPRRATPFSRSSSSFPVPDDDVESSSPPHAARVGRATPASANADAPERKRLRDTVALSMELVDLITSLLLCVSG